MIGFFPTLYPDELLYSGMSRYHARNGYGTYRNSAEDFFQNPQVRPDIEFMNAYTENALSVLTSAMPLEELILRHTMFLFYGAFLPLERRKKAFSSLLRMEGGHRNYLSLPLSKQGRSRFLRYCPLCAETDRETYGETYWHRSGQLAGISVCPIHGCFLIDSNISVSGKAAPAFAPAELSIPYSSHICYSDSAVEKELAAYVFQLFTEKTDILNEVEMGTFLHTRLEGTKYLSPRGEQRNIGLLYRDFTEYYRELPDNRLTELWQLQKVFAGDRFHFTEVAMLAMFLQIAPKEAAQRTLPKKTQVQVFEEQIRRLHSEQGLNYPEIARRLGASVNVVKPVGEGRYGKQKALSVESRPQKGGPHVKEWETIDIETLPLVQQAIERLWNGTDTGGRPGRVTVFGVEKALGLPSKRLQKLPRCMAEIQAHYESFPEYWAREVSAAACRLEQQGLALNWKHIREMTNLNRRNFQLCLAFLEQYAKPELAAAIREIL